MHAVIVLGNLHLHYVNEIAGAEYLANEMNSDQCGDILADRGGGPLTLSAGVSFVQGLSPRRSYSWASVHSTYSWKRRIFRACSSFTVGLRLSWR